MPLHASLGLTVPKTVARLDPAEPRSLARGKPASGCGGQGQVTRRNAA